MKGTQHLHDLGQRLGLDSITRVLLSSKTLKHYIGELSLPDPATTPRIGWHEE